MQRSLFKSLLFFCLFSLFPSMVSAAETYKLDPNHSYVLWHINHFGFSNPSGKCWSLFV